MQQQIGLEVSKHNPPSLIILNRLGHLVRFYGGASVLGSMLRLKKKNPIMGFDPRLNADIHIMNLMETYGKTMVLKLYTSAYTLDNKRKSA